jgi:hypothetical protein
MEDFLIEIAEKNRREAEKKLREDLTNLVLHQMDDKSLLCAFLLVEIYHEASSYGITETKFMTFDLWSVVNLITQLSNMDIAEVISSLVDLRSFNFVSFCGEISSSCLLRFGHRIRVGLIDKDL